MIQASGARSPKHPAGEASSPLRKSSPVGNCISGRNMSASTYVVWGRMRPICVASPVWCKMGFWQDLFQENRCLSFWDPAIQSHATRSASFKKVPRDLYVELPPDTGHAGHLFLSATRRARDGSCGPALFTLIIGSWKPC